MTDHFPSHRGILDWYRVLKSRSLPNFSGQKFGRAVRKYHELSEKGMAAPGRYVAGFSERYWDMEEIIREAELKCGFGVPVTREPYAVPLWKKDAIDRSFDSDFSFDDIGYFVSVSTQIVKKGFDGRSRIPRQAPRFGETSYTFRSLSMIYQLLDIGESESDIQSSLRLREGLIDLLKTERDQKQFSEHTLNDRITTPLQEMFATASLITGPYVPLSVYRMLEQGETLPP